jgi:hypothetical protein
MDWPTLLAAVREHTKCGLAVLEHDEPNDVFRFLTRSMAWLQHHDDVAEK